MAYKYFIFSNKQYAFKKDRDAAIGKKFKPGYVILNGRRKNITEINTTGKCLYTDYVIVAQGEESTIKFEKPNT